MRPRRSRSDAGNVLPAHPADRSPGKSWESRRSAAPDRPHAARTKDLTRKCHERLRSERGATGQRGGISCSPIDARGFERRVHRGLKQRRKPTSRAFFRTRGAPRFSASQISSFSRCAEIVRSSERFSLFRAPLPNRPPWSRPASHVTSTSPARTTGATTTTSWTYVPDRPAGVPSLAARASRDASRTSPSTEKKTPRLPRRIAHPRVR